MSGRFEAAGASAAPVFSVGSEIDTAALLFPIAETGRLGARGAADLTLLE